MVMLDGLTIEPLRRLAWGAIGAVLPPRCLGCGAVVDTQGTLCAPCWSSMNFLGSPQCACCGIPFEVEAGETALCGACLRRPPEFDRARAVFRYDDNSRHLIIGFKHSDRTHGAPAFGKWMARAGAALLAEADLIAPVPLHWTRLFGRRYNQAALLAQAVARETAVPMILDLLIRKRRTPMQVRFNVGERHRNMRGAFAVDPRYVVRVTGRRVLLFDDVFTTGATVGACASTLRKAGAAAVDVLALARVVRPLPID